MISKKQIEALKHLVLGFDTIDEVKKILFALINASDGLTQPVCFTIYSVNLVLPMANVLSSNFSPLDAMMELLGAGYNPNKDKDFELLDEVWMFSHHDGYFSEGKFIIAIRPGKESSRTVWLSLRSYDKKAKEITEADVEEVELVDFLWK